MPPDAETPIDRDLLLRAEEGDEAAWREMVRRLYPQVAGIVRNHLRRHADHEDVVQEVFLKAFLKLNTFRGTQPFEHWISRISVTTCYDWLRKIKARPAVTHADLSEAERAVVERTLAGAGGDEGGSDSREAMRELLNKLIGGLKPDQQVVIRLLDLEERSVREVSELTGFSESKVKVTAMRARRKLSELLQQLEGTTRDPAAAAR